MLLPFSALSPEVGLWYNVLDLLPVKRRRKAAHAQCRKTVGNYQAGNRGNCP